MFNGLQYIVIFIVGFFLSILMYFIGHKQSYGSFDTGLFDLSTLLPFYRNFMFMGPSWLDLPTLKSTLYSAIFIGLFCLATLLLTDFLITLYYKYFTT